MTLDLNSASSTMVELRRRVQKSIFGQEDLIEEVLCALVSGGHILMTGAPGLAKTTLVRVIGKQLGLDFGRIQFTPDLLPGDITGSEVLNIDPESGQRHFQFHEGPVFVNLLLADEINRASPRTQSALLEAMQERSCTIGGKRHRLPQPFMVLATQNPFESEGTFPLPEAQLDRFLLHCMVDYPTAQAESEMLQAHVRNDLVGEQIDFDETSDEPLMTQHDLQNMIALAKTVHIDQLIVSAVGDLVRMSRPGDETCPEELRSAIWYGAGPRAGISLLSTARAHALLNGRQEVRWHDIQRLANPVLRHRIRLSAKAIHDRVLEDAIVQQLMQKVEAKHHQLALGGS